MMRRLQHITSRHRARSTNALLGLFLAFNAGAINAGGFLVLHMYTSHMSGFASQFAEGLALDNAMVLLNALGAIFAFTLGAAVCSILVNWARQHQLHSVYALPLMLEALLMLPFGLMGAVTLKWNTPFAVPLTVLLLSFIMGLQNALGSKTSSGSIRTTHMTGNITDLGMELGKLFFWRGRGQVSVDQVPLNWQRAGMCGGLLLMFVLGGILGSLGFKHIGFICVVPLAIVLLALSVPPFLRDVPDPRNLFSS